MNLEEAYNSYVVERGNEPKCLHLGCGHTVLKSWLNTDLNSDESQKIFKLDVRKKFIFPDNSFDYIYTSHMIEHLSYIDGKNMLKECYRILKLNGVIRISCPTLDIFVEMLRNPESPETIAYTKWYANKFLKENIDDFGTDILPPAFILNSQIHSFGHKFIYDLELLKMTVKNTGFVNVTQVPFGISKYQTLNDIDYHCKFTKATNCDKTIGRIETHCVEAIKKF